MHIDYIDYRKQYEERENGEETPIILEQERDNIRPDVADGLTVTVLHIDDRDLHPITNRSIQVLECPVQEEASSHGNSSKDHGNAVVLEECPDAR